MNDDLSDAQIRSICEKNGIKVGPLTSSTRKIYLKKIEKMKTSSTSQNYTSDIETLLEKVNQMSKDELAQLPNNEFILLVDYFEVKKMPLNDSSKKILASKIYLKLHNIENMDWEYADHDLAELDL